MQYKLIYYLVIPLLLISSIFIVISFYYGGIYSNLLLNLGTELIAIVIVVVYVDWVIKERDEARWARSMDLILEKLRLFNTTFINAMMIFGGLEQEILDIRKFKSNTPKKAVMETLKVAEDVLLPKIMEEYLNISPYEWKSLHNTFKWLNEDLIQLILLFGNKIDSNYYSELLSIQIEIENIIKIYDENPELYQYQLTKPKTEDERFKLYLKKLSAQYLEDSLKSSIDLTRKLINEKNEIYLKNSKSLKKYRLDFEFEIFE